jgi:hypothetical protein
VESGHALAPISEPDSADTYASYAIAWNNCGKWETLRVVSVPGAGVLWVQLDGGRNDDLLKVVRL